MIVFSLFYQEFLCVGLFGPEVVRLSLFGVSLGCVRRYCGFMVSSYGMEPGVSPFSSIFLSYLPVGQIRSSCECEKTGTVG